MLKTKVVILTKQWSTIWIIFLLFIAVLLTICGIFFIHRYFGKSLCKKESQELSDGAKNDDTAEQQTFLKSVTEDTSENQQTIRHEDETITGARRNGNSCADVSVDETSSVDSFESSKEALPSPCTGLNSVSTETPQNDVYNEIRTNEMDCDKSAEVNTAGVLKKEELTADIQNKNKGEENLTENASGFCIEKSDGENDKDESTDVFDDTSKSLQKEGPTTDEQGRELSKDLFNLLEEEGKKLTWEVMTAVITRETGKSLKMLFYNLTDQDKSKLKGVLPEESHRILESITEFETSFHVSYGLNRIFLDEKHHPKSGWGNPIRNKDIGVGDDVERLYRIITIVCGIPDPVTVSVEDYIRLLDIMMGALTRLDPKAEFMEDYEAFAKKLTRIKNPTLTDKMIKNIMKILPWQQQ